jgi:hypothetical protein
VASRELEYAIPIVPTVRLAVVTVGAEMASIVPPKLEPAPTVTQFTGPAQDTPRREPTPVGALVGFQFDPPLAVLMMVVPPSAVQAVEVMQLIATSVVPSAWPPRSDHAVPPLLVSIT